MSSQLPAPRLTTVYRLVATLGDGRCLDGSRPRQGIRRLALTLRPCVSLRGTGGLADLDQMAIRTASTIPSVGAGNLAIGSLTPARLRGPGLARRRGDLCAS